VKEDEPRACGHAREPDAERDVAGDRQTVPSVGGSYSVVRTIPAASARLILALTVERLLLRESEDASGQTGAKRDDADPKRRSTGDDDDD